MNSVRSLSAGSCSRSAPNWVAISRRAATGSDMTMRSTPRRFRNASVNSPIMPPPITTPTPLSSIRIISEPERQHDAGSDNAACSRSRESGIFTADCDGAVAYSANIPEVRSAFSQRDSDQVVHAEQTPQWLVVFITTRSPIRLLSMPFPTSTITPEPSCPRTFGGVEGNRPCVI